MRRRLGVLVLGAILSGVLAAAPPERAGTVSRYRVNAQFRGGLKKGLGDLGTVTITERELGAGSFSVSLAGSVRDPDEAGKVYSFSADVSCRRLANALVSRIRSRFSEDAEEYKDRILEMAPFVRVLERDPIPAAGAPAEAAFTVNQKPYTVRYASTEKNVEATLYEGLRTVGKFFLLPTVTNGVREVEKFRVNTVSKTVLSFVKLK